MVFIHPVPQNQFLFKSVSAKPSDKPITRLAVFINITSVNNNNKYKLSTEKKWTKKPLTDKQLALGLKKNLPPKLVESLMVF